MDIDPDAWSGVNNTLTWADSTSSATLMYRVKRNTTNSLAGATIVGDNVPAGTETFTDFINRGDAGRTYYYFIEVTDGTNTASTVGVSIFTSYDYKFGMALNYRSKDVDSLAYNPGTDSFM